MIYYFVTEDGLIETEDAPRGYFSKESNPHMLTQKKQAIAQAKTNISSKIAELEQRLMDLNVARSAADGD